MDYNEMADGIIADAKDLKNIVGTKKTADVSTLLPVVIKAVEAKAIAQGMSSDDKKALAVAIISKLVKTPQVPDELKPLIVGKLVDAAVAVANKFLGKHWFEKAK